MQCASQTGAPVSLVGLNLKTVYSAPSLAGCDVTLSSDNIYPTERFIMFQS